MSEVIIDFATISRGCEEGSAGQCRTACECTVSWFMMHTVQESEAKADFRVLQL